MKPLLKISDALLTQVLDDLDRPHDHAYERLGFLSFKVISNGEQPLLLCHDYHIIPDEHYIEDMSCGARMSEEAIHAAMQRSIDSGSGQLWVHTHGRDYSTIPSPTDLEEGPKVARSISNISPGQLHGWAVLSERSLSGQILALDRTISPLQKMTVVGWPMTLYKGRDALFYENHTSQDDRYDRQSFLGNDAAGVIAGAKIGIIGLGGGGSHINQQLAHIGFQNTVLCDYDTITNTNLNRLVGGTKGCVEDELDKTIVAEVLYRGLQPDALIDSRPLRWEEKIEALNDCDVIIGCVDSFSARRDIEYFCRARMIPMIDIGMIVVNDLESPPRMHGQAAISIPGEICLHCLRVITEENLAEEAQDYGAGPQPQVVWPNGVLASTAIGYLMHLVTGWSRHGAMPARMDYNGIEQTLKPSGLLSLLSGIKCPHYSQKDLGDPVIKPL
ncbi:MAG: ThiF family adenylyltransferase [Akkermansiaceae bacterium]|nr:ThiF family adenylyltransferase [Akkermansiaceae bacterium]